MPYKYIGRTTDFKGKTLWEIVGNLKNYGVGRIVTRNRFEQRYPEPTFMKILKVETLPSPKVEIPHGEVRKVKVLVERTFRGKLELKPTLIESTSYKADYKLIPKDEEEEYCKILSTKNIKVLPRTMDFPPVLKELIKRDIQARGEKADDPKLEIVYLKRNIRRQRYRVAAEGEEPDLQFEVGLGKPISPSLYDGITI